MKNIRSVFILLIGMVSLTAFATTSKLDQKQKTELVSEFTFQANDVIVVNEYQVTPFVDATIIKSFADSVIINAVITDVGWRKPEHKFTSIQYKEKLLENCNDNFVYLNKKVANSIRSDC